MLVPLIVPTAVGLTLVMLKAVIALPDEGATLKTGVTVASPESATVVDALAAFAKLAFDAGDALHEEKTYPEAGVAVIVVAASAFTVSACAGCMLPHVELPGVNVTELDEEEGEGDSPGCVQPATRIVAAMAARKMREVLTTRSSKRCNESGHRLCSLGFNFQESKPDGSAHMPVGNAGAAVVVSPAGT